jgi:hypothetical protein
MQKDSPCSVIVSFSLYAISLRFRPGIAALFISVVFLSGRPESFAAVYT